jgi:hypothetical protein
VEHAEAHERLADLALEPRKLSALQRAVVGAAQPPDAAGDDPAFGDLRRHVAGCERCLADVKAWMRTWSAVGDAREPEASGKPGQFAEIEIPLPPERLRVRTLAAVRKAGQAGRTAGSGHSLARRTWPFGPGAIRGLLAAAAIVTLLVAGAVAVQSRIELGRAQSQQAELAATTVALDRILAAPSHQLLSLRAADGSTGGTLAWSDTEFVVLTSRLNAPAPGQEYRCWVDVNGTRTVIGSLAFAGRVASWYGSMTSWGWNFAPGTQFGVSLYGADGTSAAPVLVGTIPSA